MRDPQKLVEFLDQITFVICATNSNYEISYASKAFQNSFGKKKNLKELFDKANIKKIKKIIQAQVMEAPSKEIAMYFKPNQKWYAFQVTKLKKGNLLLYGHDTTDAILTKNSLIEKTKEMEKIKNAVLNLLEDMTETQKKLRQANKDLRQLDNLKNEFISIASHELRTPMTSIKGFLSMIMEGDAGPVSKDISSFIKEAYQSNEHLIALVNDMLDVSRIEQGRIVLEIGKHKALPLINEIIDRMATIARDGRNKIILKSDVKDSTVVMIDPKRFQQVLLNLLSNSIKFSEKSNIIIEVKTINKFLSVSIIDQGIGMTKKEMSKLFQKFYQVRSGLSRPTGGSGLGLYITKNLIKQMKGSISVQSEKGKGSTFTFTVPLYVPKKPKSKLQ